MRDVVCRGLLGALLLSSFVFADYLDDENDAIVIEGKTNFYFISLYLMKSVKLKCFIA